MKGKCLKNKTYNKIYMSNPMCEQCAQYKKTIEKNEETINELHKKLQRTLKYVNEILAKSVITNLDICDQLIALKNK